MRQLELIDCSGGSEVEVEAYCLAVSGSGRCPVVTLPRLWLRRVDALLIVHILDLTIGITATTASRVEEL